MSRRAFTLVELLIVLSVLALMAAVMLPRYAAIQAGQQARSFSSALMRVGADARLIAIETGQVVQARYDGDTRAIVLETVDAETLETTERRTIALPESAELTAFTLEGQFAAESDWTVHFYPDGSGLDAGVEVQDGTYVYHVLFEGRDGTATSADGRLEEVDVQEWQAGELEQRI